MEELGLLVQLLTRVDGEYLDQLAIIRRLARPESDRTYLRTDILAPRTAQEYLPEFDCLLDH